MEEQAPQEAEAQFASRAKVVTKKRFGRQPEGILSLSDGRLRFDDDKHGITMDVPVADIANLESPGWMVGASFRFDADGTRYTCGFYDISGIRVHNLAGYGGLATAASAFSNVSSARELCSAWMSLLQHGAS